MDRYSLTLPQAELRSDISKVTFHEPIYNDSNVSSKPVHEIQLQDNAPDDLRVVSWPPGTPSAPPYYAYDDDVGKTPIIYMIDKGFDGSSDVRG